MAEQPLTRSREFAARHADFNETLVAAHNDGHTLADESLEHLKQTDRLDVGYWLSLPRNRLSRDKVHNLTQKPKQQIAELDRIAAQLDREGFGQPYERKLSEEDQYRQQREQDIRVGKRRR
ncbi:MAG: hypothetical protein ACHQIK_17170 [Candidatus Acidiferrales bacterium]